MARHNYLIGHNTSPDRNKPNPSPNRPHAAEPTRKALVTRESYLGDARVAAPAFRGVGGSYIGGFLLLYQGRHPRIPVRESLRWGEGRLRFAVGCPYCGDRARHPTNLPDEPDIHLNPALQATELTEVMRLLPNGSHLRIATHSVGMIRRAFDISTAEPGRVAFLDFGQVKGPAPDVQLKPSQPSGQLLHEAMSVALDGESASSLAPSDSTRSARSRRGWPVAGFPASQRGSASKTPCPT